MPMRPKDSRHCVLSARQDLPIGTPTMCSKAITRRTRKIYRNEKPCAETRRNFKAPALSSRSPQISINLRMRRPEESAKSSSQPRLRSRSPPLARTTFFCLLDSLYVGVIIRIELFCFGDSFALRRKNCARALRITRPNRETLIRLLNEIMLPR